MGKYQIQYLLDELKSGEISARNDAIKKIIKEKIDDEQIIIALKEVVESDTSMSVRNFARAALNAFGIEHSAIEQSIVETSNNEVHAESPKVKNHDQNNIERGNVDRVNKSSNGYLVGGIAGFVGGLVKYSLYYYDAESFGVPMICLFMPIISPLAGALSVFIVNYFIEKSEPNDLLFCAFIGFLAGFLPFLYYISY